MKLLTSETVAKIEKNIRILWATAGTAKTEPMKISLKAIAKNLSETLDLGEEVNVQVVVN